MPEAADAPATDRPPLGGGTRKANAAQWVSIEAQHDPADLPRLMVALRQAQSPTAAEHVKLLAARAADPALVPALLDLIEHPPYTGGQSKKFFQAVIAALAATRSARARDGMTDLSRRYAPIMGTFMGEWIAGALGRAAANMDASDGGPDAKTTGAAAPATSTAASRAALFAQIVAAPDDDAPRAVYADVLLAEDDDARGEFIALQLARAAGRATAEQLARERTLLAEDTYIAKFALPLSTAADAVTFERGFPVAVLLKDKGLDNVVDAPEWGTVRKLRGLASVPTAVAVKLVDGHVPNARDVGDLDAKLLGKLKGTTYPWTTIALDHGDVSADALVRFPALRRLELTSRAPVSGALLAAAPALAALAVRGPCSFTSLARFVPRLRELELRAGATPELANGLALARLAIDAPIRAVAEWFAAVPGVATLELQDDGAFRDGWDWAALTNLLATPPPLASFALSRWRGALTARFERTPTGWTLVWPCGARWAGFYEEVATLAKPLREAGVTSMVLESSEPAHYARPFADTEPAKLDAIDRAWQPIAVPRHAATAWPSGVALEEGWVLNRSRRYPSR